jgi:hypothetical protein
MTSVLEASSMVVIFGCRSDKDIPGMLDHIQLGADKVIFTTSGSPRSADPAELAAQYTPIRFLSVPFPLMRAPPPGVEVVAVADADAARCREAAERLNCRTYKDFESLCNDPAAELVVVATPSTFHPEHTIRAFAAGKHVVCEKPLCMTLEEADRMRREKEEAYGRLSERMAALFSLPSPPVRIEGDELLDRA